MKWTIAFAALAGTLLVAACSNSRPAESSPRHFATPEDAVRALTETVKSGKLDELLTYFGPEGRDLVASSDPATGRRNQEVFIAAASEEWHLEDLGPTTKELVVGNEDWPFPIPLVKDADGWRFDAAAGKEEVLARRIGRNELETIQVLQAMADAQVEYARADRARSGQIGYAQKFASSAGKKDGLYWSPQAGEPASPLGPLVAQAAREGYGDGKLRPYHGYVFRMLKGQGPAARGGAFDYMHKGVMIGGFAIVAHPVSYGTSGVMTFMINQDAVVWQKDLGPQSAQAAAAMKRFDPGPGWTRVR